MNFLKIEKTLTRFIGGKKRLMSQIISHKNERADINTESTDIKRIMSENYELL